MEMFVQMLATKVDEITELLAWEICKPLPDSRKEVERTIKYIHGKPT
jgi:hypothetical protein